MKAEIETFMVDMPCPKCEGARLKPESLAVTIGGLNINQVSDMSITEAYDFFSNIKISLSKKDIIISENIFKEIKERLKFLKNVGLEYLTLSRSAGTLSGGEMCIRDSS